MPLTSMKRTPKNQSTLVTEVPCDKEELWPYGLRINLEEEDLDKLGIGDLPEVGAEFGLKARVVVRDTSAHESSEGKRKSVGLQIVAMDLVDPDKIAEESTDKALRKTGKELVYIEDG